MGSGPSLPLSVAESALTPGLPAVVSDPIEHDYDAFFDESLALLKYPVSPMHEPVLKECKVTENGDTCTVQVILDGGKLAQYGFGNPTDPSLDRVEMSSTMTVDRAGRKITTHQYKPHWIGEKDDEVIFVAHVDLLADPLRIEYYWDLPDGTRKADQQVIDTLQPVVNAVMGMLAERKVLVKLDAAKHRVVSEVVDESLVEHEALFSAFIAVLQQTFKPTVEEISECKVKLIYMGNPAPVAVLTWDKEAGTILSELTGTQGEPLPTTRYSLSKEPVVLEVEVTDADGKSIATVGTARQMQGLLDAAIAQATGSNSWFGLF